MFSRHFFLLFGAFTIAWPDSAEIFQKTPGPRCEGRAVYFATLTPGALIGGSMSKWDDLSRVLESERRVRGMNRDAFARFLGLGNGKKIGSFYNAILSAHRNFPKKKLGRLVEVLGIPEEDVQFLFSMRQLRMRKLFLPNIYVDEKALLQFLQIVRDVGGPVLLKTLLERLPELRKRDR